MKILFSTLALSLLVFLPVANAESLESFLDDHGVKVNAKTITDRIEYFLDPRYRQKKIFWFAGGINTSKGEKYDKLELKYNTVSNTVFVRHEGQIYNIPTHKLSGFFIVDENGTRQFKKGFSKTIIHSVTGKFTADPLAVMNEISKYEMKEDFKILNVFLNSVNPSYSEVTVEFSTKSINLVSDFNSFIENCEGAASSEIASILPEYDENTFLEIKVVGGSGVFLKMHYKDSSQSENMTQIKQTDVNTYNKNFYFFGNEHNEIVEVQLTRKSMRKGLKFIGIMPKQSLPSLSRERQAVSYLKSIL
ncbi:MAG: hypothetical protein AAF502_09765 [Bacteroidota bacterium]